MINTMYHGLTVTSVITELRIINRAQPSMKAYRLIRNKIMVILNFDFHIASTSKGSVRKYSYEYQANFEISNTSIGIKVGLAQSCDIGIVEYHTTIID